MQQEYGLSLNQKSEQWISHVISESKPGSYRMSLFFGAHKEHISSLVTLCKYNADIVVKDFGKWKGNLAS
jgi:hypothetical protein